MRRNTQFSAKYAVLAGGGACLLVSFRPEIVVSNPQILRPLLNVSWGYLFGSNLWSFVSCKARYCHNKQLLDTSNSPTSGVVQNTIKNNESFLYRKYLETLIASNVLANGVLLVATSSLAPSNKLLRICSGSALLLSMANLIFALPSSNNNDEVGVVKTNQKCCLLSEILSLFSFCSIIPYVFA